jgi:hypothetical protein
VQRNKKAKNLSTYAEGQSKQPQAKKASIRKKISTIITILQLAIIFLKYSGVINNFSSSSRFPGFNVTTSLNIAQQREFFKTSGKFIVKKTVSG